jgi:alkylation response protein AidB-like acyl-CoA dehydrogenase
MTVVSMKAAAARPSVADLLARAREIAVLVRAQAERTEADRMVSSEAMAQMRDAGLFRIMQPAVYSGYEYGFDVQIQITAAIGAGCGSAGWVFGLSAVHQWLVALFPKQAQDEFFADLDMVAAGSYAPVGKAVPVSGGYRLTGNWSFTSGCDHAQWIVLGGMIPPAGEGVPPKPAFFLLPRADVTLDDTWFTMGLAGTGSKNSITNDVFVPAHRAVLVADLVAGTTPGAAVHANPLYRQAMLSTIPFTLVAPILGMAEGALADFIDMAKARTTRGAVAGGNNRMADFATIQTRVAEATGSIEAARLTILHALDNARQAAEAGRQADLDVRLRNRLSQSFSTKLLVQAVDALFLASGGQSIFTSKPIQRAWRDAHAGAVHVSLNWDAVSTMYGQHALGLDPRGQY